MMTVIIEGLVMIVAAYLVVVLILKTIDLFNGD
jgi:hypothetical protein